MTVLHDLRDPGRFGRTAGHEVVDIDDLVETNRAFSERERAAYRAGLERLAG